VKRISLEQVLEIQNRLVAQTGGINGIRDSLRARLKARITAFYKDAEAKNRKRVFFIKISASSVVFSHGRKR
jgi:ABC-type hemin transport system substrate-binding protein